MSFYHTMFTFIFLIFFVGFMCLMNTSKRISWPEKSVRLQQWGSKLRLSRNVAGSLFLIATVLSMAFLGIGSGIFAAVVMLMAAGCLSILFFPFRYLGLRGLFALFVVCFIVEQFF